MYSSTTTKTTKRLICKAPAKLILSGEHSVLYNSPALSVAIPIYSTCESVLTQTDASQPCLFNIELPNYQQTIQLNRSQINILGSEIKARYQQFLKAEKQITKVLTKSTDLFVIALYLFQEKHALKHGDWKFKIQSDIPTGRGLGSSASVIVSFLQSLYQQHNMVIDKPELLAFAQKVENFQHGHSSGLDPATIINGGLIHYKEGRVISTSRAPNMKAWLVDSGKSSNSTGDVVLHVKQQHAENTELWNKFTHCSDDILNTINKKELDALPQLINYNQSLLNQIGVVPKPITDFIMQLNNSSPALAAKVCGAGSINGKTAGVLIVIPQEHAEQNSHFDVESTLTNLCNQYGYTVSTITLDNRGTFCEVNHNATMAK